MNNLEFSVPYNNDPQILKNIFELKKCGSNSIREIFLSGAQEYAGSGRISPKQNLNQFLRVVDDIHKEGLRVNLVINSVCEGGNWYSSKNSDRLLDYIKKLHEEHGLEAVTIANPVHIKMVRKSIPSIEICASVLSDIDSVQRAAIFRDAGADTITPDANINRDLELLKEIKKTTGARLKLMVNEGCLYKCPFRKFHFNYISHRSREIDRNYNESYDFTQECCIPVTEKDNSQILKSGWIRPEDAIKYSEITNYFKIVGRATPSHRTLRTIKAYMEENWEGDLLDIMCSSLLSFSLKFGTYLDNKKLGDTDFFERVTTCNKKCHQCRYCNDLIRENLMLGWLTREKLRDQGYVKDAEELEKKEREIDRDNSKNRIMV
jgi:collagenase-like PrtC family protease